jgi:calpain-7
MANEILIKARVRIPISQRSGTLSILASYDGDARDVGFTLSAFAKNDMKITWVENTPTPPYTFKVQVLHWMKTFQTYFEIRLKGP